MTNNQIKFNLNAKIENPLRIIFLCGSVFTKDGEEVSGYKDKRVVLTNYLKGINNSYKSLILEESFLFSNRDYNLLNYNDIGLKSLKSIELLTSLISDKIIIFHESYSTAAEIGLFSSNKEINNKMLILAPDEYTFEDKVISGFIKLAYNNIYFEENNIKVLNYYPGVYKYKLSENNTKLHTYFPNNQIEELFGQLLINELNIDQNLNISLDHNETFYNTPNTYFLENNKVILKIQANYFVSYLISLFTVDEVKKKIRTKLTDSNDRKFVVFYVSNILNEYLIQLFHLTFADQFHNEKIHKISIIIDNTEIKINEAIKFFVYILYGLKLLVLSKNKASISVELDTISKKYSKLITTIEKNELSELIG